MVNNNQDRLQTKVVDSSEPQDIQMSLCELGWERRRLACGDYTFFNHEFKRIGIERKCISDFLVSLGDRLSGQLEACLDYYDETILLIEGSWQSVDIDDRLVSSRGIEYTTWKMAWNYLRQRQRSGVTIELTGNPGHTIERLNELYALYQQPWSKSGKSKRFDDDRILSFPSGCRGASAQACLDIFGSLKLVGQATKEQLLQIPGIGPNKADRIYEHFNKFNAKVSKEDHEIFLKGLMPTEQERLL